MNLEQRNGVWYVTILVPADVREVIGRVRFKKSLGTYNKRQASLLAAPYIAAWKAQIKQARGSSNAVANEALRWKAALSQAPDEDAKEAWDMVLADEAARIAEEKGHEEAKSFFDLATGATTPSNQHFEAWKAQIKHIPKTKDQMVKDVGLLVAKFPTLQAIQKAAVRRWVDSLEEQGKGDSSIRRILSWCRNYWEYLKRYEAVDAESAPFDGVLKPRKKSKGKKATNFAYSPAEVVKLWEAASKRRLGKGKGAPLDVQLADLIKLGAYTGARIEELCAVRTTAVKGGAIGIDDSKTPAGIRTVPIHSAIAPLVDRLVKKSKDGYLISGLTFNKYEGRSNAIGKRYGRLKAALGFSEAYTFHSFRSTVATLLQNAHVPEDIAADIIGHDKPTMTYGLYSGGASLDTKREALERISYPFPAGA